jgi:hypothetical protein
MGEFYKHITFRILSAYVILKLLTPTKSIKIQTYYLWCKRGMEFMCKVTRNEQ